MAPERSPKRQKVSSLDDQSQPAESLQPASGEANNESTLKLPERSSWYSSWSRKALPSTEVARGSVRSVSSTPSVDTTIPSSPKPRSIRSPSLAMALGKKQSSRGLPIDATTTKVNAEAGSPARKGSSSTDRTTPAASTTAVDNADSDKPNEQSTPPITTQRKEAGQDGHKEDDKTTSQRSSWLGWIGKSEDKPDETSEGQQLPNTDVSKTTVSSSDGPSHELATSTNIDEQNADIKKNTIRKSWLPWSNDDTISKKSLDEPGTTAGSIANEQQNLSTPTKVPSKALAIKEQDKTRPDSAASSVDATAPPPSLPHDGTKASAWAFWSRERRANLSNVSVDKPHEGEIAISDTPSQGKPKRASISVPKPEENSAIQADKGKSVTSNTDSKQKEEPATRKLESTNAAAIAQEVPQPKQSALAKTTKADPSVLLPDLHATLKIPVNPSIIQQLARLLYITKEPQLKHLSLVRDPPRIRNALAIGVHGYFPATFIRTVIGQPTGTSIKFADMASKAIKRWTKSRGYDCEVKSAALEGEGKIAERVDLLWKLLLNWIEEIRKSDFVLIACHSQGVPVAIMLVAKLIQFGCLSDARVGICAMAGVNMGPFPEYKSRFIGGSAGELFEFSDSASKVSQEYLSALEEVLKFGARVTFIGSIDDQLVSLESSIFSSLSHPHIYRAVSIDARLHAPTFLSHLVGFALKLRNLGIQDHGLIRELSSPLAGSLYTGDGHSRIYESDNCYDMAVDWALLTTSMSQTPLAQQPVTSSANNPYILPFAMRGILEEEFVKTELKGEASELLMQFDEWKPTTKVLKDVKFRLEGIRSKL